EYSTALFEHQNELADAALYDTLANETGVEATAFTTCRADPAIATQIETDAAEALRIDVKTQPNLVLWHNAGAMELIDGYVNMSYVESALADELNSND
ncbi:MAG: hypothetical protein ACD_72C00407G0006, partial [uncultured bacterium]